MPSTPETTFAIPETVTLPGELLFDVISQLDWLGEWAWDQLAGRTTSGVGDEFMDAAWRLFWPAFHGVNSLEEMFQQRPDFDNDADPARLAVERRSTELGREWAHEMVERYERVYRGEHAA